ncbi:MAG: hypothetical protein QNJ97_23405 [Myxococcota bacterium]|nr:hypothetical protein [Myxococcota bacterium]
MLNRLVQSALLILFISNVGHVCMSCLRETDLGFVLVDTINVDAGDTGTVVDTSSDIDPTCDETDAGTGDCDASVDTDTSTDSGPTFRSSNSTCND